MPLQGTEATLRLCASVAGTRAFTNVAQDGKCLRVRGRHMAQEEMKASATCQQGLTGQVRVESCKRLYRCASQDHVFWGKMGSRTPYRYHTGKPYSAQNLKAIPVPTALFEQDGPLLISRLPFRDPQCRINTAHKRSIVQWLWLTRGEQLLSTIGNYLVLHVATAM